MEKVRDGIFLHDRTMFALAQRRNVFIYDDTGTELHRLEEHVGVRSMQFLPHHWLLNTTSDTGMIRYHDTSTGKIVSQHRSRMGCTKISALNESNAVVHCGHTNGTVSLWSPAQSTFLAKIQCHRGNPISAMCIDRSGSTMITAGQIDHQIKIWDLRNTYQEVHSYQARGQSASSLDLSQRNVLAVGHGSRTTFWPSEAIRTKVSSPYMSHTLNEWPNTGGGIIEDVKFRPYEDVCALGHNKGFTSLLIPGSGEPELDSAEIGLDPFCDTKRRREGTVRGLMDKLAPGTVSISTGMVGTIEDGRRGSEASYYRQGQQQLGNNNQNIQNNNDEEEEEEEDEEDVVETTVDLLKDDDIEPELEPPKPKEKKKMRGRSKTKKKLARKRKNVIDKGLLKLKERRADERRIEKEEKRRGGAGAGAGGSYCVGDDTPK